MSIGDMWRQKLAYFNGLVEESVKSGRPVQRYGGLTGSGPDGWTDLNTFDPVILDDSVYLRYRVAPESKKRPIRIEELPGVFWVRREGHGSVLVTYVSSDGIRVGAFDTGSMMTMDELSVTDWEWSPDRKDWHSFEVCDV